MLRSCFYRVSRSAYRGRAVFSVAPRIFRCSTSASTAPTSPTSPTSTLNTLLSERLRHLIADGLNGTHGVHADLPLMSVANLFINRQISAISVTDEQDCVIGIITERDLIQAISQPSFSQRTAGSIMTPASKLVFATPQIDIDECIAMMRASACRHLPIIDTDQSKLVGILSVRDLLFSQTHDSESAKAEALHHVLPHRGLPPSLKLPLASHIHRLQTNQALSTSTLSTLSARFTVSARPHASKAATGGEDAHFVYSDTNFTAFGVADGVGSWSFEKGVDGSQYARALMSAALLAAKSLPSPSNSTTPESFSIIERAWKTLEAQSSDAAPAVGATTACVCVLDRNQQELNAANIGDSGFVVLRRTDETDVESYQGWRIVYTSPQQLVYFNCPFQLGRAPINTMPGTSESAPVEEIRFQTPADVARLRVPVRDGDLVLLATDGLFDNVQLSDVLKTAVDAHAAGANVAQSLLDLAHKYSLDRDRDSPFALLAKENMILWRYGGRPDDITVIACHISATNENASQCVSFPEPSNPVALVL